MNRAVEAKLKDPSCSLSHAIRVGGFHYPGNGNANSVDGENVTLGQRKNQLNRRLRKTKTEQLLLLPREQSDFAKAAEPRVTTSSASSSSLANGNAKCGPSLCKKRSSTEQGKRESTKQPAFATRRESDLQGESDRELTSSSEVSILPPSKLGHAQSQFSSCASNGRPPSSSGSQQGGQMHVQQHHRDGPKQHMWQNHLQQQQQQQIHELEQQQQLQHHIHQFQKMQQINNQIQHQLHPTFHEQEHDQSQHACGNHRIATVNSGCSTEAGINAEGSGARSCSRNVSKHPTTTTSVASSSQLSGSPQEQVEQQEFQQQIDIDRLLGGRQNPGGQQEHQQQRVSQGGNAALDEASGLERDQRMDLGLCIFQNDLELLYRESMLRAGFSQVECNLSSQSYQAFAFHAWKAECERLQTLLVSSDGNDGNASGCP